MGMFSKELLELDKNTVDIMIEEFERAIAEHTQAFIERDT
jgi:hypothetical protein